MQGLVQKPEGDRQFSRTGRRWADKFAMNDQEVGWVMDLIGLTHNKYR
jgi:hypothetical protein